MSQKPRTDFNELTVNAFASVISRLIENGYVDEKIEVTEKGVNALHHMFLNGSLYLQYYRDAKVVIGKLAGLAVLVFYVQVNGVEHLNEMLTEKPKSEIIFIGEYNKD